jgi:hypothetical protein
MDGTAVGCVVTVIPEPVAAGGGAAEAGEVVVAVEVAEAAAVVDSSKLKIGRASALEALFLFQQSVQRAV